MIIGCKRKNITRPRARLSTLNVVSGMKFHIFTMLIKNIETGEMIMIKAFRISRNGVHTIQVKGHKFQSNYTLWLDILNIINKSIYDLNE